MMQKYMWLFVALAGCACASARAQLEVVTNAEPQRIFFGPSKKIPVLFRNAGDQDFDREVRTRVYQLSSGTAVLSQDRDWKRLRLLPRQTVIESAVLDFPPVRARTKFLVQWLESTNRILGATEVWAYPTNLLAELKPLAGGEDLGVYDPQHELAPLLKSLKVTFTDLEDMSLENFSGKLAIFGSFKSKEEIPDGLAKGIQALARRNVAVVWLQPPSKNDQPLEPSFCAVPEKQVAVLVVQPALVSNLADNPLAQIDLTELCRRALHPRPTALPGLVPSQ
jgi:hypothetical protein